MFPKIFEDMHVHSRFSDGEAEVEENVEQALRMGLLRMCCVDHVRRDTPWVAGFVSKVRSVQEIYPAIELFSGLEAKILNQHGDLDVPANTHGADFVYAADHRFPLGDRCHSPEEIRQMLRDGRLSARAAVSSLVEATWNAMLRHHGLVLAHLFSILPKVGLSQDDVTDDELRALAGAARETWARIEISERWRCPPARVARFFDQAGVPVFSSTDAHRPAAIGVYQFVTGVKSALFPRVAA